MGHWSISLNAKMRDRSGPLHGGPVQRTGCITPQATWQQQTAKGLWGLVSRAPSSPNPQPLP